MSVSDFLRDQLAALREAGCIKGKVTFGAQNTVTSVEVEFAPGPVPAAPFVDASGNAVDLDEGAGPLTKDPDAPPAPSEEPSDAAIERANFKPKAA